MDVSTCTQSLLSMGLYKIVEGIIGPKTLVELRRTNTDVLDSIHSLNTSDMFLRLIRGSRAEGFEMDSSDIDVMFVMKDVVVLTQNSLQVSRASQNYNVFKIENSSPGFVLIESLNFQDSNTFMNNSLVRKCDKYYVSSKRFREMVQNGVHGLYLQGPCVNRAIDDISLDYVFCLYSKSWPDQAMPFVSRSIQAGWPSLPILEDVCRDGCLLVPINSKEVYDMDRIEIEWRISFSLAEKRIIQSLNHYQFLCYGLLKIFVTDILNPLTSQEELFNSYYMKNCLFWEISNDPNGWTVESFLNKFWKVLHRLLTFVTNGYCPHFFIPERNMFYGKIYGRKQEEFLEILRFIYREGIYSLLRSDILSTSFRYILQQPSYALNLMKHEFLQISDVEEFQLGILLNFQRSTPLDLHRATCEFENIIRLHKLGCNFDPVFILRTNFLLQRIAEISLCIFDMFSYHNRDRYRNYRFAYNIIRRVKSFRLCGEHIMIKHFYRSKRYYKTIQLASSVKTQFDTCMLTYKWSMDTELIMNARKLNASRKSIIQDFVLSHVVLTDIDTIDELRLEVEAKKLSVLQPELRVPPFVFLHFLLFLSYNKTNNVTLRNSILSELDTLIVYDNDLHIDPIRQAISWEILGICYHICGAYHRAKMSFIYALKDKFNDFKTATIYRLNHVDQ